MRASSIRPSRTSATIRSGHSSPPNWSTPAPTALMIRSSASRCSTPQARAGSGLPIACMSVTRPQSVHTTPSKPSSSRRICVMTCRLYPKPTSSIASPLRTRPTGIP